MNAKTRAPRAPRVVLKPGEHSIERVKPKKVGKSWVIFWRIKLWDGRALDQRSQAPSKTEARARALQKAKELLATGGDRNWSPNSQISDYMEAVTKPAIQAERLAESTRRRYLLAYRLLLGACSQDHKHRHALRGLTIAQAMKPRTLKACLEEIAQLHGLKNLKHAKLIASKYVARQLKLDGLVEYNPLSELEVDTTKAKKPKVQRGGHSLTKAEYHRAIDWLLNQDPEAVDKPLRGRWTFEDRVKEREELILFVLTQASTGMRTSEIALRPTAEVEIIDNESVVFVLPPEATKTRRARRVPVLNSEVSKRLIDRIKALPEGAYLFGTPTNPMKPWAVRNRDRKLKTMYEEMAKKCDIPMFEIERGHSWRTTINSITSEALPEDTRIRLLGHTREINRSHYTQTTEVEALKAAASKALGISG